MSCQHAHAPIAPATHCSCIAKCARAVELFWFVMAIGVLQIWLLAGLCSVYLRSSCALESGKLKMMLLSLAQAQELRIIAISRGGGGAGVQQPVIISLA